jgi:hypothetical protein
VTFVGGSVLACIVVIALGVKVFGKFLHDDPCDGDGNFRAPMDYYDHGVEEPSDVEPDDKQLKKE